MLEILLILIIILVISIKILILLIVLSFNNTIINKLIRISLMRHNIIISSNSLIHKYKFVSGYRYVSIIHINKSWLIFINLYL